MSASDSMAAFVRWVMRDTKYHKHYLCTVQMQLGSTVDLLPDDPAMRGAGLSGVPITYGLPGVTATFLAGTKMTLFFENGDPAKPRAQGFEGSHVELSFADGTKPVARVGDTIMLTSATSVSGGAVTGSGTIMGGAPTVKA